MNSVEATAALENLASKYSLRYVEATRRYLGLHQGMGIEILEFERNVTLTAFSPGAVINDQILEDFSGFTSVKESGVPTLWIRGTQLKNRQNSPDTVRMELTPQRLAQLSEEQFVDLPARLAEDFRQFGGAGSFTQCGFCGADRPTGLLMVDTAYAPACDNCQARVPDEAKTGVIQGATTVRWLPAIGGLLGGGLLYTFLWGGMQQAESLPTMLLLTGPFFAAIALAILVTCCAGGTSLMLRLATSAVTLAAVFAGNIWGLRSAIMRDVPGAEPAWDETARFYFQVYLPQNDQIEGLYLLGGLVGTWVGMGIAKSFSRVRVE